MDHPQKITFAEMRDMGIRGLLVYCADYRCSHSIAISGDGWPDDVRLSDIEPRFICQSLRQARRKHFSGFSLMYWSRRSRRRSEAAISVLFPRETKPRAYFNEVHV